MLNDTAKFYLTGAAAVLVLGRWIWHYRRGTQRHLRPPPGPPSLPIIGNAMDIPAVDSHVAYSPLARHYGPIMQFQVLGNTVIVLNDVKTALDLLETRGAIYSGRPKLYSAWESGFTWVLAFMPQDNAWRVRRQLVHQQFHAKSTAQMHGLLRRTALGIARDFLHRPETFREHIRHAAFSIINAVYGIEVAAKGDPYAEIAECAVDALAVVFPGASLMDVVPLLRYVPAWVPFLGSWTAQAHSVRKYATAMLEVPYARAKDDLREGKARTCMAHNASERMQTDASITEQAIKDACAVSYLDTTMSTLLAFVMAMVLYPEYQRTAHTELDRVLGDRLPDFADKDSLPYVEAITRETYRRYPVGPLGLPHSVDEDDEYNGFFIRRGSTVMVNVWHIMHDEATYPEPEKFDPDRWLKSGKIDESMQDPRAVIFGFGRRICPGRYFADASIFLTIATVLKCFDLSCYVENGVEMPPKGKIDTTLTSCPAPFKCRIAPRSEKIGGMVDLALETCLE